MDSSPTAAPWRYRLLVGLRLVLAAVVTATVTLGVYVKVVGVPTRAAELSPIRGDMRDIAGPRRGVRVLFLGDSLTDANSMTSMVQKLAARVPGGPPVFTYQAAPGGAWLESALSSSTVTNMLLHLRWNYVVLQQNSHVADYKLTASWTVQNLNALNRYIAVSRARPVVFEAWGYRHGNSTVYPVDSYRRAQEREQYAAQTVRAALRADLAPVGYAWAQAAASRPGLALWDPDGVHPSRLGSYLTAAVFYDVLARRYSSPSTYDAGLAPSQARWLRRVADLAIQQTAAGSNHTHLPAIRDDPWSSSDGNF